MTVKKALELLDFLIEYEKKIQDAMGDPTESWNSNSDSIKKLANTLSDSHRDNVRILNIIKKELVPNCKHPSRMHDMCKDQKYCMACNMDL